jgi:hypothetical protein
MLTYAMLTYLDTLAGVVVAAVCQALWLSIPGNMIALITDDIDRKANLDTPRREPFLRVLQVLSKLDILVPKLRYFSTRVGGL